MGDSSSAGGTKEEEVPTAPLDISNEIGSDFVLLPAAEVRNIFQDPALSTEQLHQWGETDKYANTAGTQVVTEPAKGRKRRKPETADDAPTLLQCYLLVSHYSYGFASSCAHLHLL